MSVHEMAYLFLMDLAKRAQREEDRQYRLHQNLTESASQLYDRVVDARIKKLRSRYA